MFIDPAVSTNQTLAVSNPAIFLVVYLVQKCGTSKIISPLQSCLWHGYHTR